MKYILACGIILFTACEKKEATPSPLIYFEGSQKVTVTGYSDHLMEPFISRDGKTLMFNNSNDESVNTNLHWAIWVNDSTLEYNGEIAGVNTENLEGVPTMDINGKFYFVSTRDYEQNFQYVGGDMTNTTPVVGKQAYIEIIKRFSQRF